MQTELSAVSSVTTLALSKHQSEEHCEAPIPAETARFLQNFSFASSDTPVRIGKFRYSSKSHLQVYLMISAGLQDCQLTTGWLRRLVHTPAQPGSAWHCLCPFALSHKPLWAPQGYVPEGWTCICA